MQRCHPDQVPSGIPLAAGDTPWGLQRTGNGLVAVCVEIHDKREGQQVSESVSQRDLDRRHGQGASGTRVNDEPYDGRVSDRRGQPPRSRAAPRAGEAHP